MLAHLTAMLALSNIVYASIHCQIEMLTRKITMNCPNCKTESKKASNGVWYLGLAVNLAYDEKDWLGGVGRVGHRFPVKGLWKSLA